MAKIISLVSLVLIPFLMAGIQLTEKASWSFDGSRRTVVLTGVNSALYKVGEVVCYANIACSFLFERTLLGFVAVMASTAFAVWVVKRN